MFKRLKIQKHWEQFVANTWHWLFRLSCLAKQHYLFNGIVLLTISPRPDNDVKFESCKLFPIALIFYV
jgi:hypothetical protein